MVDNTINWSNNAVESQKEKNTCFNTHFQYSQSITMELNKMWSSKRLALLKFERRTSLHAVQYK